MPNRMLRDWTRSEKINSISANAERFFVRLIMKVDDYGCYYADARILKADLFPLLDSVRSTDIPRWLDECQKAGLLATYNHESKRYLQINDFRQRLDRARSKFPTPVNGLTEPVNDFPPFVNECPTEKEIENEKETEVETENEKPGLVFPFVSNEFLEVWNVLRNQPKWKKKSLDALQASLKKLSKYPETDAIQMMEDAIAGGWQGLFEIKNNGTTKNKSGFSRRGIGEALSKRLSEIQQNGG